VNDGGAGQAAFTDNLASSERSKLHSKRASSYLQSNKQSISSAGGIYSAFHHQSSKHMSSGSNAAMVAESNSTGNIKAKRGREDFSKI
jgi:hypothetical protein